METFWQSLKGIPWATMGRRETNDELIGKLKAQRAVAGTLSTAPLFSIIVPLAGVEAAIDFEYFSQFLASLRAQTFTNWEAIFVVSGSKPALKILTLHDPDKKTGTFRWVELGEDATEAQLKNEGVLRASGDWWVLADPCGVLHPSLLFFMAADIMQRPGPDILYCNEIELSAQNNDIGSFISKPEMSWVDSLHFPYLGRVVAVKKDLNDPDHFDSLYPEYHEADRWFRYQEREKNFRLLPYFLSYRRARLSTETPVMSEWQRVVEKHLRRKGFPASLIVQRLEDRDLLKVTPVLSRGSDRLVSVVICFRDKVDLTLRATEHMLRQSQNVPLEFILVNNHSSSAEMDLLHEGLRALRATTKVVDFPETFNFARMNNLAIREHCKGEFILVLNNDVFWRGEQSLDQLVAWAALPSIGTVGIRLIYPDGRLQHSGLGATFGGEARLARIANIQKEDRFTAETREVFINTFAACLFRRQVFDRVGGLRELEFANGFGDVVFNFECLKLGLKNINLGHILAEHMESASRGTQYEYWEEVGVEREFPEIIAKMLRQDLGENRTPGQDVALGKTLKAAISQELTAKAPRLKKGLKQTWGLFSRLTQ